MEGYDLHKDKYSDVKPNTILMKYFHERFLPMAERKMASDKNLKVILWVEEIGNRKATREIQTISDLVLFSRKLNEPVLTLSFNCLNST